jgi:lysyl-tRNA synthetase class 1
VFRYSLLDPAADVAQEARWFRPAFSHLAVLAQVPGADVAAHVTAEKGSGLERRERDILDERLAAARAWLATYAPESARMAVRRDGLPDEARALSDVQRGFLLRLAEEAPATGASGEGWQSAIFASAAAGGLPAGEAFRALYLAFLGRPSGPRAGWLLASLDREFVAERLRAAAAGGTLVG